MQPKKATARLTNQNTQTKKGNRKTNRLENKDQKKRPQD